MEEKVEEDVKSPLYVSNPTKKSMGNTYLIYSDRLELKCMCPFVKNFFMIRKADLVSIHLYKPPVVRTTGWALKLDWADLHEHVGLIRKNGFFKQLRFTPENPDEFRRKVEELLLG